MSVQDAQVGRDLIVQRETLGPGATAVIAQSGSTVVFQGPALGSPLGRTGEPPAEPACASLSQITAPVPDFTGREDKLADLRRKVKEGGVAITGQLTGRQAGVRGMAGAGKTQLARRLAAELKPDYPDLQFELDLKGVSPQPLSAAEVLAAVLRVFHPTARLPEREEELAALLRRTLEGRRALLLLDNAKDAQQIKPLLPAPPGCLLLVTSRRHFVLPGLEAVDLGVMEPSDARALLLRIAPRIGPHADALAETCGRLPLALRLAASLLAASPQIDPPGYTVRLRDSRERLRLLDKARECTAEDLGLEASFNLSFDQLPPAQKQRFARLAVFPDSYDLPAAAAVWETEESAAGDALDELLRLSLLEWKLETQRFELHDLLRDFARNQAVGEELEQAALNHAKHYIGVGERADELFLKGREHMVLGLALFDLERTHLEAAFDWLESRGDQSCGRLLNLLVNAVAYIGNLRFHPRQRVRWLEAQGKAARLTGDRRAEGDALGNLGPAYRALGDARKAMQLQEQALAIHRELGDRRREGTGLGNLGVACRALGDARGAIEFYQQQLVIVREIGDRRGEGIALGNLGRAYFDLDDVRGAIGFFEQQLVIARDIGDRRGEGNALGSLGSAYAESGDAQKAIRFWEQALVIVREIGDLRMEGATLWSWACQLWELKDGPEAIARAEAALRLFEAIEDPNASMVRATLAEWKTGRPGAQPAP